jgi:hypothetical protein
MLVEIRQNKIHIAMTVGIQSTKTQQDKLLGTREMKYQSY